MNLPSFSIVLETENLANANLGGLAKSLASLAAQGVSPALANEVILIDSGDAPPGLLQQLSEVYPWIQLKTAPLGTGYYKAKMLGAELATGEVVVYFDSDCRYEPHWLQQILTPFAKDAAIQVVAGETQTRGRGPYGTAMALTYIFPRFSNQQRLAATPQYFLNNVAFRRDFLLRYPLPTELPLYRGNCAIHASDLRQAGHAIWRQPLARAHHAPPSSLSHFFWRFLMIGYDYYWQKRLLAADGRSPTQLDRSDPVVGLRGKLQVFWERSGRLFVQQPQHWLYLPLALPIVLASLALILVGYAATALWPHYLLHTYNQILGEDGV
ncbi:MAG: glycosyltransferase family 2 protein [Spirulinaceae cyanobacterium SM2_1_0]|nr:glycosyltransferase family 2 protein [Spirulinaceae cyanobacterium SM2_1_0]